MRPNKFIILVNLVLLLILLLVSCDFNFGIKKDTRGILQNGIKKLGVQPGRWQMALTSTIDELGKVGG